MELQVIGWYIKLSSDINVTGNINGCTQVCTFFNNDHLMHDCTARRITKYLASTSIYTYLTSVNRWLSTRGIVYRTNK